VIVRTPKRRTLGEVKKAGNDPEGARWGGNKPGRSLKKENRRRDVAKDKKKRKKKKNKTSKKRKGTSWPLGKKGQDKGRGGVNAGGVPQEGRERSAWGSKEKASRMGEDNLKR